MKRNPVILCVGAEERALQVRTMVLENSAYTVLSTTNPERALQILSCFQIDLVVADHPLHGMDGNDLAQQIKSVEPDTPVVLLSGSLDDPEESTNTDLVIRKGEPTEQILAKLEVLLSRNALLYAYDGWRSRQAWSRIETGG